MRKQIGISTQGVETTGLPLRNKASFNTQSKAHLQTRTNKWCRQSPEPDLWPITVITAPSARFQERWFRDDRVPDGGG